MLSFIYHEGELDLRNYNEAEEAMAKEEHFLRDSETASWTEIFCYQDSKALFSSFYEEAFADQSLKSSIFAYSSMSFHIYILNHEIL